MTIRTRKNKNGTTSYDVYVGASGKRRYRTVHTLSAAKALEKRWKAEMLLANAHKDNITLKRYIESIYWPIAVSRLAASSLDTYEKEIRLRIMPGLGNMRLQDIDRPAIQVRIVDRCASSGIAKKAIGVLKTILNEALSDGYISKNYACSRFALPSTPPQPRDNGLVLSTFDEIYALLDKVDERASTSVRRIAYTGLLQGLRPEERYALDWSCFDMRAHTITISEARIIASKQFGGVQDKTTKTRNSQREIPMHPRFFDMLQASPPLKRGAFILSDTGGRISPSTAQNRWRKFLENNPDCPPVTIENMRHSFATAYLSAGGRIEVLSRILGHANIHTTINRYYKPNTTALNLDMLRINAEKAALSQHNSGVRFSAPPPKIIVIDAGQSGYSDLSWIM